MKLIWILARLGLAFAVAAGPAGAEIYRWTDAQGKVHFSNQKPAGDEAERAEAFHGGGNASFMGGGGSTARVAAVRMFTTQWCPVCKKAKAYLKKRGTPFEELDIERSRSAKAEYTRLGGKGVPVTLVGEQRINGFNAEEWESVLKDAGL
ncbi:DUF4124 domain-containing protein [Methylomagnum sp.]